MEITQEEKTKQAEFLALYEPLHEQFARYCKAVAGEEQQARDLINETLLKAFEGFEKIRKKESFLYYLFGTAKRIWSNQNRRNKFWHNGEMSELGSQHFVQQNDNPEMNTDTHFLYRAMEQLPDEQREALVLFEILGFSLKEIQAIQKTGLSAVKARLARGRKKLESLLADVETKIKR